MKNVYQARRITMEIDIKDFMKILKKKLWIILLFVIAVTVAAAIYSFFYKNPVYEATSQIIVNKTRTVNGIGEINVTDVEANLRIISTYKELLKTDWMMKDVVNQHPEFNLSSKELINKVNVSESAGSQVMSFSVLDSSYQMAAAIVNAVTQQFSKKIPDLIEVKNIIVLNEADPNDQPSPVSSNPLFLVVIAFFLSIIISVGLVYLKEYFDDTLKSEDDIHQVLDIQTLAIISRMDRKEHKSKRIKVNVSSEKVGEQPYVTTN
jgi:capsular polysaccharide biosynthesis protein